MSQLRFKGRFRKAREAERRKKSARRDFRTFILVKKHFQLADKAESSLDDSERQRKRTVKDSDTGQSEVSLSHRHR